MRRQSFPLLLVTLAVLGLAAGARAESPAPPSPSLEEIVAHYTAARGGLSAWRAVQAMEWSGTFSTFSKAMPFTQVRQRPSFFHYESATLGGPFVFGRDATGPWWVWPLTGSEAPVRPDPPYNLLLERDALIEPPLLDYAAKGHKAVLLGPGDIEGQPTLRLTLTLADGTEETWHLDPKTYLELAIDSQTYDFTQSEKAMRKRSYFSDFRQEGGLVLPHVVEGEWGARYSKLAIAKVRLNPAVDAKIFAMPPAPPPPATPPAGT